MVQFLSVENDVFGIRVSDLLVNQHSKNVLIFQCKECAIIMNRDKRVFLTKQHLIA